MSVCMYMCVYVCMCMDGWMDGCVCMYACMYVYIYIYTYIHVCMHEAVHITHTHAHTNTHNTPHLGMRPQRRPHELWRPVPVPTHNPTPRALPPTPFPLTSIRRPPPPHASLPRLRIRMGISRRRPATGRTVGKRALPGALPREVVLPVVLARRQVDLLARHRCYKTLRDASVPV